MCNASYEKEYDDNHSIDRRKNITKRKRLWLLIVMAVVVFLCLWEGIPIWWESVEAKAHVKPQYAKENIEHLLYKTELCAQDYELFFKQTGLGAAAVDALRAQGRQQEFLILQENFFADVEVECEPNTVATREERIEGKRVLIPYVENGDILINFNCHALGWRNGHAAIVVDAGNRLTLEARVLGTDSAVVSMRHWECYPSIAVLRLKGVDEERRAEIAEYARKNLIEIPYRLEAGIVERAGASILGFGEKNEPEEALSGTHCAHLIWYAYQHFGYDLDSDGGVIVTPRDIYESPLLEVIQIYGVPSSRNISSSSNY